MKSFNLLLAATAGFTLIGSIAAAQPAPTVREACMADRQRLCPGVARGPDLRACMKSHRAEFSQGCVAAMQAARAEHAQEKAAAATAAANGAPPPAAGAPAPH